MQALIKDENSVRNVSHARLDQLRTKIAIAKDASLGVGYQEKDQKGELIFIDLQGKRVVSLPTRLTRQEFESVKEGSLDLAETRIMLFELASAYSRKEPLVLEGGTAIGKTFAVSLFAKLLYGEDVQIPDFYCNGQTDVSELMGKWVPTGLKPEEARRIQQYLKSDAGAALKSELLKEGSGSYESMELFSRAALELGILLDKGKFEFQLGVLPKAMTAQIAADGSRQETTSGNGVILHIQELGMAAPSVINALLKLRGDRGKIAAGIQVWEDGGRKVVAGDEFFVVCTTNPPGKGYLERFAIDPALARGMVWVNLPERLSSQSLRAACAQIFNFDKLPAKESTVIDLREQKELAASLGELMAKFHRLYEESLENGEEGRRQKVPATIDSLWRVATILQEVQIPLPDFSGVDMVATLKAAVQGVYINCLQSKTSLLPETRIAAAASSSLGDKLLKSLEELLTNDTTELVEFRGKQVTRAEKITNLTEECFATTAQEEAARKIEEDSKQRAVLLQIVERLSSFKGDVHYDSIVTSTLSRLPKPEQDYVRELLSD